MRKFNINKRDIRLIAIVFIAGIILGWLFFHNSGKTTGNENQAKTVHESSAKPQEYTCSMHPQIRMTDPNALCPICAMELIPVEDDNGSDIQNPNEIQMSEAALKLAEVKTMLVKKRIAEKQTYLLGKVKIDERNISEISARFGGRIEKLLINYTGQHVKKGQHLAVIYSPELVATQKELLEALNLKEKHPALYTATRNKLKLWNLSDKQIDQIEKNGKPKYNFNIYAPISGTVTMRHIAEGDYIKEGMQLFQVIDFSKVWVLFEAYERHLPWIKTGDKVKFNLKAIPGKEFTGIVNYIDPYINAKNRIANVRVDIENIDGQLKPEMFVNGSIHSSINNKKVITVPKTAILWTGKQSVVFVKVPDREKASFLYRKIELGAEAGDAYVITKGLEEGEEIVIYGAFKVDAAAQLAGKRSMMNPKGVIPTSGHNKEANNEHNPALTDQNLNHYKFKVAGNCAMCKDRIEKAALDINGVEAARWNQESMELHCAMKPESTDIEIVHKAIADAGHDTEINKASNEAYNELHECCKYERLDSVKPEEITNSSFLVAGNCGMCKDRIENAAKGINGVLSAEWNIDNNLLSVKYKKQKVDLSKIHKTIAAVGHDTKQEKANNEVYNKLHACCKYERIK